MSSKEKRGVAIEMHKAGKSPSAISKALNMPRQTVYKALKRFAELGTSPDRPEAEGQ